MEAELKYSINSKEKSENIWRDPYLLSMEEVDSRESLYMKAAYFDTADGLLKKNDIAFRVRQEGSRIIASLKWNGKTRGALHTREELNVPVQDEACLMKPKPELFQESEIGREVLSILEGAPLINIMEVGFLRKRLRVDTGKSIMEISIDKGEIITDKGRSPICELEIELFSGEEEELLALGERISTQYELSPEVRSKYSRGLDLLDETIYKYENNK